MHKYTGRTPGGTLLTIAVDLPMKKSELRFMFHWYKEELPLPRKKPKSALDEQGAEPK